jgi:hypothetical protein
MERMPGPRQPLSPPYATQSAATTPLYRLAPLHNSVGGVLNTPTNPARYIGPSNAPYVGSHRFRKESGAIVDVGGPYGQALKVIMYGNARRSKNTRKRTTRRRLTRRH